MHFGFGGTRCFGRPAQQTHITFFVVYSFGMLIGQDIWQRVFTARSPQVAKWGGTTAAIYCLFYGIAGAMIGTAASTFLPAVEAKDDVYAQIAETILPVGISGLVLAAAVAAMMSTASGALIATATVARTDIKPLLLADAAVHLAQGRRAGRHPRARRGRRVQPESHRHRHNVKLAAAVGLSPAGARRRVVRLVDSQVVRIGAVVRHSGQDRQSAMGLGIRLSGDGVEVVAALAMMPSVLFVARTLGRFDLLATVRAFSAAQLVEVLDVVRALPGVSGVESWVHLEVVKENYASLLAGQ